VQLLQPLERRRRRRRSAAPPSSKPEEMTGGGEGGSEVNETVEAVAVVVGESVAEAVVLSAVHGGDAPTTLAGA
jgi:hypothetical protein